MPSDTNRKCTSAGRPAPGGGDFCFMPGSTGSSTSTVVTTLQSGERRLSSTNMTHAPSAIRARSMRWTTAGSTTGDTPQACIKSAFIRDDPVLATHPPKPPVITHLSLHQLAVLPWRRETRRGEPASQPCIPMTDRMGPAVRIPSLPEPTS